MKRREGLNCSLRLLTTMTMVVALAVQFGCSAQRAYHRAQTAAKQNEWDRAVGQYMLALNKHPDNPAYKAGFERARLAASQFHFQKAKELVATRNFEQAIVEYQFALNFDPTNQFISNELARPGNCTNAK